jgi:hypothetical protein
MFKGGLPRKMFENSDLPEELPEEFHLTNLRPAISSKTDFVSRVPELLHHLAFGLQRSAANLQQSAVRIQPLELAINP